MLFVIISVEIRFKISTQKKIQYFHRLLGFQWLLSSSLWIVWIMGSVQLRWLCDLPPLTDMDSKVGLEKLICSLLIFTVGDVVSTCYLFYCHGKLSIGTTLKSIHDSIYVSFWCLGVCLCYMKSNRTRTLALFQHFVFRYN